MRVAVVESNERVGKKLLATGNGKCNLTNLDMNIVHYNKPSFVESFLDRFDAHDTIATFEKWDLSQRLSTSAFIRTANVRQPSLTC